MKVNAQDKSADLGDVVCLTEDFCRPVLFEILQELQPELQRIRDARGCQKARQHTGLRRTVEQAGELVGENVWKPAKKQIGSFVKQGLKRLSGFWSKKTANETEANHEGGC